MRATLVGIAVDRNSDIGDDLPAQENESLKSRRVRQAAEREHLSRELEEDATFGRTRVREFSHGFPLEFQPSEGRAIEKLEEYEHRVFPDLVRLVKF